MPDLGMFLCYKHPSPTIDNCNTGETTPDLNAVLTAVCGPQSSSSFDPGRCCYGLTSSVRPWIIITGGQLQVPVRGMMLNAGLNGT